ncbi:MAG: NAD-dependent epimerase/dehydratase family protein [Chloroflexi bacterium]|nr:NAD-dependent epimerase/dehydratase family protein [Chloroflexota bacterium]
MLPMIAIITGATGFIGRNLVELLLAEGFHVRCLDINDRQDALPSSPKVTFHRVDCADLPALQDLPVWEDAQYLFHLAGVTQRISLAGFRAGNVTPTQNLLHTIKVKQSPLKRFLFVSSQAAAGPASSLERPFTEMDKPQPIEAYGISKLEGEKAVNEFGGSIPITIIRPSAVYGPGDRDFLNVFRSLSRRLGIYPGCRDNYLSVIYVKDLVKGIVQAAKTPESSGETYFLAANTPITWQTLYNGIAKVMAKTMIEINIPQFLVDAGGRVGDYYSKRTGWFTLLNSQKIALSKPDYWICSAEKASQDYGFAAETSLMAGLTETYYWYKEKGWL